MRLLLDTHVLLWWLNDDPALGQAARRAIAAGRNTVYVSAASAWEIAIKKHMGKLSAPGNLRDVIEETRFVELPVTIEHAIATEELPLLHVDPFDRMLIAQARIENLTLVTHDERIMEYEVKTLRA